MKTWAALLIMIQRLKQVAEVQKYLFMYIERILFFTMMALIHKYVLLIYTTQVEVSSALKQLFNVSLAFSLSIWMFKLYPQGLQWQWPCLII